MSTESRPQIESVIDLPNGWMIVTFQVGYHQEPPAEVQAAADRIRAALKSVRADTAIVQEWGGSAYHYDPVSRLINPEITAEMEASFIATATAAYPSFTLDESWINAKHGVVGYSVRLRPA